MGLCLRHGDVENQASDLQELPKVAKAILLTHRRSQPSDAPTNLALLLNQFPNCFPNPAGTPLESVSCHGPLRLVDQVQPLLQR